MATIIDKPDALNLSGNMRKFVLGAKEAVSFILKKGTATLLEQSYEPRAGQDGHDRRERGGGKPIELYFGHGPRDLFPKYHIRRFHGHDRRDLPLVPGDPVRDSGSGGHAGKLVEVPLPHVAAKGQGGDLLLTGVADLLRHIGLHGKGQGHVPGQLVEHDLLEGNDRRRVRDAQPPIRDRSQAIREQVPQLSRGLRRGRRSETERIAIL